MSNKTVTGLGHLELELFPEAPVSLLVAPGGYGKSHWLDHWCRQLDGSEPVLDAGDSEGFSDSYFTELSEACLGLGLPVPDPARPEAWTQALGARPLTVRIDDWERLEIRERVQAFWQGVLLAPPPGLRLLLASRKPPRLPLAPLLAHSGNYYGPGRLSWPIDKVQALWQARGRSWDNQDDTFFADSGGWPLGLLLWLRWRSGQLDEPAWRTLLQQALQIWLPPFVQDPAQLWQPEIQARLKEWQADSSHWPPLLLKGLEKPARSQPAYWLAQATSGEKPPAQARVLLERSLSLCQPGQRGLRLSVLTRLAHTASLEGSWELLDRCLDAGAELIEDAQGVDAAAWYYLQANRSRQCCRYPDAHRALDALLALPARSAAVMNFQVRARILRGLTAYQQGDYELTRESYREALYLAEADGNAQMQLELRIMLAFLDALLGQTEEPLPASLLTEVEALPLGAQPLVWLNLAFLQLLGEHLDLRQGQLILERVRSSAHQLAWRSLEPMIADVEARLWRFHQDHDRAERLHHQALSGLEPQTFDWLYASLNHALTLLRRKQLQQARPLLETICARARESGTHGLLREAQAALQALDPGIASERPLPLVRAEDPARGDEPLLEIQCFGSFQLRIDGKPIERWPRKRARHLLLQLLLHPHGLHRETLADWLTGSDDLEQALRSLDVHIHALRKLLEPERKGKQASRYIRFHDAVYSFHWDCHYRWDVEGFASAYARWLKLREAEPEAAEQAVNAALELYSGPFLPELDFADEWLSERESYARKAGDLVLWSLEHLSRKGEYEQAEDRAELLLKWDSVSELGFLWLLRLAGSIKDRSRLERLGERMEQTFHKELGCPPTKELLQTYLAQLQQVG
ncbi:MAG: hypothetical protein ACAI44_01335 [Candidatus Sericytochromatia bacterium]